MKDKSVTMTQRQYARARGVSEAYVSQLKKAGRVVMTENGLVDVGATDRLIDATRDPAIPGPKRRPATPEAIDFHYWRSAEMKSRAQKQELETARLAGELVWKHEVDAATFARARQVQDSVLAVPDRVAPLLAVESDPETIRQMLDRELRRVLEDTVSDVPKDMEATG